jgi:hypothetical protein
MTKDAGAIDQTITGTFLQSGSAQQAPIATFEDFTYLIDINETGDSNVTVKSISIHHGWDDVEGISSDGAGSTSARGFVGRDGNTFSLTFLRDDQSVLADTAYEKGQPVKITITAGASLAANWNFTSYFCTGKIESIEYTFDGLAYTTLNCNMLSADENSNMAELDLS